MLVAWSCLVLTKSGFFFFSSKLFTDKKYSKYCDLVWKVWLIINVIICFVWGSSKIPRTGHGLIGIGRRARSRVELVTVSGDGDVLEWTAWGWHPVFGKHPSHPLVQSMDCTRSASTALHVGCAAAQLCSGEAFVRIYVCRTPILGGKCVSRS